MATIENSLLDGNGAHFIRASLIEWIRVKYEQTNMVRCAFCAVNNHKHLKKNCCLFVFQSQHRKKNWQKKNEEHLRFASLSVAKYTTPHTLYARM